MLDMPGIHMLQRNYLSCIKNGLKKVEAEKAYTGYEVQNDMPLFYEQLKKKSDLSDGMGKCS